MAYKCHIFSFSQQLSETCNLKESTYGSIIFLILKIFVVDLPHEIGCVSLAYVNFKKMVRSHYDESHIGQQ